jgi:ATP-dependent Lon protease
LNLSGYTGQEKIEIAKNYLIPKSLENAGLNSQIYKNKVNFS